MAAILLLALHAALATALSPRVAPATASTARMPKHAASDLLAATASPIATRDVLVLMVSSATLMAAGSITLLVFASLVASPVPTRSLVAALTVTIASALLEALVGHTRRATFVGATVSEVGPAIAIAASGWASFSALWACGFGRLLTPGREPFLNGAAVLGCTLAAAVYGRARPASRVQTAVPFASALGMVHLHLLVTPDVQVPKLAPMAVATSCLALAAVGFDVVVQRAVEETRQDPRPRVPSSPSMEAPALGLAHVRGTEDMVMAAVATSVLWNALTLCKWSVAEAPSWGFVTLSTGLSGMQLALAVAQAALPPTARSARAHSTATLAGAYRRLAYWLALLGAWRALWPDEEASEGRAWRWRELDTVERVRRLRGKRERHYSSLVGAFTLWGLTSAATSEPAAAALALLLMMVVVFKTSVAALFGEPLLVLGLAGLAGGGALLTLLVRFASDDVLAQER